MGWLEFVTIIFGLALFEVSSGVENAIINADVLRTMPERFRRWFLFYGMIIAVLVVRAGLPLLIVYTATPGISVSDALTASFQNNSAAKAAIEAHAPIFLAGGGVFLILLFFSWLFLEGKAFAFTLERYIYENFHFWFYAVTSMMLLLIAVLAAHEDVQVALGAVAGSTAFFIIDGFKRSAEEKENQISTQHFSNFSKLLYLELLDAAFSVDGVLGAFAFTISVPLIMLGNGFGAFVVRYFTIRGIDTIKKYMYLKNGAMYAMGFLGLVMVLRSLNVAVPQWIAPLITFVSVGFFFLLSRKALIRGIERVS